MMNILLVDDVADTRKLLSMMFHLYGHQTALATNGAEAVEAVRQAPFDAIVMDLEMPVMDGLEATRQIRLLDNGQRVPIVMFTGYDYSRCAALKAGASDLVQKPIDPEKLLSHITALKAA